MMTVRKLQPRTASQHKRRSEPEYAIDQMIADRVRAGRGLRHLSQTELGKAIGITFQQIQKYENTANRVSAGRLVMIAKALDLPLSWFFDDVPDLPTTPVELPEIIGVAAQLAHLSIQQRRAIRDLVDAFTADDPGAGMASAA